MTPADPLTSAAELSLAALTELFNRAYEGYEVPMHVDAGAMAFMHEVFDLVPEHSRVAWHAGHPVGVGMLGARGSRGWVGGLGVVVEARRSGVGERLMRALIDEARALGVRSLGLEVLEQNHGAHALYEKLGFRGFRRLEVLEWECPRTVQASRAQACDPRAARRRIAAARTAPEPWQRADETLDRLDVSTPALRAVTMPGGDAVYRVTAGRASVLQSQVADTSAALGLLDMIAGRDGVRMVRYLNVPEDDPVAKALRTRGANCTGAQTEMVLAL